MVTENCAVHDNRLKHLEESDRDQWEHINGLHADIGRLMQRWVPAWVSLVLTVAGFVTGSALTFAGMMIRFALH